MDGIVSVSSQLAKMEMDAEKLRPITYYRHRQVNESLDLNLSSNTNEGSKENKRSKEIRKPKQTKANNSKPAQTNLSISIGQSHGYPWVNQSEPSSTIQKQSQSRPHSKLATLY